MSARVAPALGVIVFVSACALTGKYDFDGYSEGTPDGGGGRAGQSAQGGSGQAGKGGAGQSGQAGAVQAGQSGQGGAQAGTGGAGQSGQGGAQAGTGGAGQSGQAAAGGAGQSGQSGSGGAGQSGQAGAGAGQSGQGGAQGGDGGTGQSGQGSGGCANPSTWYYDGDFDNHGTSLLKMMACSQPPATANNKWVDVGDDCNDANDQVYPGQLKYSGTPYADPSKPGGVSFDYDCDGDEKPTAPTYAPNCGGLALGSCSGTGYTTYTPARSGNGINSYCGSTHTISCVTQTVLCVAGPATSAAALQCK